MKMLLKLLTPVLLLLLLCLSLSSCNNEELFIEDTAIVEEGDNNEDKGTEEDVSEDEEIAIDPATPCDFTLDNVEANSTIILNCVLDLNGATINLPSNVNIVYEGGEIINGTLNLSEGITIDGDLLNNGLTLSGAKPQLRDPVFKFKPERWGIVEVEDPNNPIPPSSEIALQNHIIIQETLDKVSSLGISTFEIDELNAFFRTVRAPNGANLSPILALPSNFHLKMGDKTFIRVFPLDDTQSSPAIMVYKNANITISGGNIIGDRLLHGPTPGWNTLITIKAGKNILVDGVHTSLGPSAGIGVNSFLFEGDAGYIPSENVRIFNCTFDRHSLAGIAITDGQGVLVENSKFTKTGLDVSNIFGINEGLAPRTGIIIEAAPGQTIDDIIIRNNTVEESDKRSILAVGSSNVIISGNTTDKTIGWTSARNVEISYNTIDGGGITAGYNSDSDKPTNGVVFGNQIKNASTGIQITNRDIKVYNNEITNCTVGLMIREMVNSEIYNNTITSDVNNSFGINAQQYADNVIIRNNNIKLSAGRSFYWTSVNYANEYSNNKVYFTNNTFDCGKSGTIVNGSGYEITENEFIGAGFSLGSMKNVLVSGNSLKTNTGICFGINKTISSKNITVKNNIFESTNSSRLSGYGIKINTVGDNYIIEDSNILFENNIISVVGVNYGIHSTNFNGLTFTNNTVLNQDRESIYFRGNNSTFNANEIISSDIQGDNNIVNN